MRCKACNIVIEGSRRKCSVAPSDPKHKLHTGTILGEEEDLCSTCIREIKESYYDYMQDPEAREAELKMLMDRVDTTDDYAIIGQVLEDGYLNLEEE